jgi:type IV secretion system protein VirB11
MQTGLGLSRRETIDYAKGLIDVTVQLDRVDGERRIQAVMVNPETGVGRAKA